jgi:hypothetical protein
MSIWGDDKENSWEQFHTREGAPTGHANERTMLDIVGGPNTIRTQIRDNPDGSQTRLKTRGGFADFVTTEVEQEKPKPRTYYCAAIPVDVAATDGLIVDSGSLSGFSALVGETAPVSAELDITATAVKYKYNRRWVNNTLALPNKLHPGNRNWFDGRTELVRQTDSVVSWWCPFMTAERLAFSWLEKKPWIGDSGVTKEKMARWEEGLPLKGTWDTSKGYVFVDGVLACDFGKHVWAAAMDSGDTRIVAIVTQSIDLSENGYGRISTSPFLLVAYDIVNNVYSEIANLGGGWFAEDRAPMAVFSHDATEALVPLNIPTGNNSTLHRVYVATGAKVVFRSILETNGGAENRIVAARYDVGGNIRTVNESSFYNEVFGDSRIISKVSYREVIIEGLTISRHDMTYSNPQEGGFGFIINEGSLAQVIAGDGQGGYLVAYLRDYIRHESLYNEQGDASRSLVEAVPYSGENFTRYRDSDPQLFSWEHITAAQDIPIYFAKAGHNFGDWIPVGVTHPWCLNQLDYGFRSRLFDMNSVDELAEKGEQVEIQFFLSTSPGGEFTLLGGRMEAKELQEYNDDYLFPDFMWAKFEQQKSALLIRDGAAEALPIEWPGAMATINSPIFYARKPVKKG